MPLIKNTRGVSLIELLIAVSLIVIAAVILSLTFSKSSNHALRNRQRSVANNIASAQVEALMSQPYAYVDTTSTAPALGSTFNTTCDCRNVNFSLLPSSMSQVGGMVYTVASCVHYVTAGTWNPQCVGDTGYKNVLVRVSWTSGTEILGVTQESMRTRI